MSYLTIGEYKSLGSGVRKGQHFSNLFTNLKLTSKAIVHIEYSETDVYDLEVSLTNVINDVEIAGEHLFLDFVIDTTLNTVSLEYKTY